MPGAVVKKALAVMPGRMVAILDACHSGAPGDKGPAEADDLVRELVSEDYGVVVLSSSLGREVSLESPAVKHGFYTLALVEGLDGKADFDRDGFVHLRELDRYAMLRVRQLSANEQNPIMARPTAVRSIPFTRP